MTDRPLVSFIGTLPPPVTGMTLVTAMVVDRLAERCSLRRFNISHPRFHRGPLWKAMKGLKSIQGLASLMAWHVEPGDPLYTVANSGAGIWYNVSHAAVARRRGFHIYVHHHVYSYIHKFDRRMARLVRGLGSRSTHIFLCPEMRDGFERLYQPSGDSVLLPNPVVAFKHTTGNVSRPHQPFRIGHISNLTVEKGLDVVLDTVIALRERSLPVQLILAGPPANKRAASVVKEARARFPEWIDYRGAVYGEDKRAFYADIDALLFPTKYAREAYPLVIAEALLCGLPVISYGRACIPTMMRYGGGIVIDPCHDFRQTAVAVVEEWVERPIAYSAAAESARARGAQLRLEASQSLDAFLDRMCER